MLGAILLNLPRLYASGPLHGFAPAGTAWNKCWSEQYGPDCDRAKKAKRKEVKEAVKALEAAPDIEPLEEAKAIIKRSLVSELMQDTQAKTDVLTAFYAYKRWKKRNNKIAAILLLG